MIARLISTEQVSSRDSEAWRYAREQADSRFFTRQLSDDTIDRLVASCAHSLNDNIARFPRTEGTRDTELSDLNARAVRTVAADEVKQFLPFIITVIGGFLITKLLEYLWDKYVTKGDDGDEHG